MTLAVMTQHLRQEVNHLVRSDPLLVQGEEEVSLSADCRKGRHSSSFSRNLPFGGLSSWCPCFAQKRRQRDIGFVLKIEISPGISARFHGLWAAYSPTIPDEPCRPSRNTDALVSGTSVPLPQPSPDRVLRHNHLEFLLHNLMYPSHRPQVCFIPERCGRLKNQVPEPLVVHLRSFRGRPLPPRRCRPVSPCCS